jgi:hypothetical protein
VTVSDPRAITAPALLGMHTFGAKALASAVVGALAYSATVDLRGVRSVPLLVLSIVVVSWGVVGLFVVKPDPMPAPAACTVAATGPIACVLVFLAIPGPVVNPNQTNALGCSLLVLAFLCVRSRIATAWVGMAAMIAVFVVWATATNQGFLGTLTYAAPSAAVLGMATLFAVIMRPAAADIRRLREASINDAADAAAARGRRDEGDRQQGVLRELAAPTLEAVARSEFFSAEQAAEAALTEAQVRDSVRARSLSTPAVARAARAARARGVEVIMFDDGAMDMSSTRLRADFCQLASEWLASATDGTITIRIDPPRRALLASIVAVAGDGTSRRLDMNAAGALRVSTTAQPPIFGAPELGP